MPDDTDHVNIAQEERDARVAKRLADAAAAEKKAAKKPAAKKSTAKKGK